MRPSSAETSDPAWVKSENVVDEQQRVRTFFVAEEFCDRQPGQRDPQTRARRLGHLPVNQRGFGFIRIARLDYAGLGHFQPKIVTFARTFAHTGEYGISAMLFGDVVDQFLNENGFADAGAAEQSNLAAFQERLDEVDDFYAGFKHFGCGRLIFKQRGRAVNGHGLGVLDRPQLVNGLLQSRSSHGPACPGLRERKSVRPGRSLSCRAPCLR